MKDILKKIFLIVLLIAIIGVIIAIAINASLGKKEEIASTNTTIEKVDQSKGELESTENVVESENEVKETKIEKLSDGTKYSIASDEIEPEIVVGDNYFATQVLDMSTNFDDYEGKTVEMEGLYFVNDYEDSKYTFVGRYSTSVVCPTCPMGYSYYEYEWHGDKDIELTDSENWIKVIGTLKRGYDEYEGETIEYYYIDATSVEVMNSVGVDTVYN